jgi:hypothetical protein
MPDWTDTIANRRNGQVPGFIGANTPLAPDPPEAHQVVVVVTGGPVPAKTIVMESDAFGALNNIEILEES